jgi:hypothetical protein
LCAIFIQKRLEAALFISRLELLAGEVLQLEERETLRRGTWKKCASRSGGWGLHNWGVDRFA